MSSNQSSSKSGSSQGAYRRNFPLGSPRSRRILASREPTSSSRSTVTPSRSRKGSVFRNSLSGSFQKTMRCPPLAEEALQGGVDLVEVGHSSLPPVTALTSASRSPNLP